jgi:hypothetical protein
LSFKASWAGLTFIFTADHVYRWRNIADWVKYHY